MNISFDNTENAFAYKNTKQLKKSRFLFKTMSYWLLAKAGVRLTPIIMKLGLPIKGLVRKTIFNQFVGGETLEETAVVGNVLGKFNVKVILDYGVEGKEGEDSFDKATQQFIKVID